MMEKILEKIHYICTGCEWRCESKVYPWPKRTLCLVDGNHDAAWVRASDLKQEDGS